MVACADARPNVVIADDENDAGCVVVVEAESFQERIVDNEIRHERNFKACENDGKEQTRKRQPVCTPRVWEREVTREYLLLST